LHKRTQVVVTVRLDQFALAVEAAILPLAFVNPAVRLNIAAFALLDSFDPLAGVD
jgi:hypothetical protein